MVLLFKVAFYYADARVRAICASYSTLARKLASTVTGTDGSYASISVAKAPLKLDGSAAENIIVLNKSQPILSCLS